MDGLRPCVFEARHLPRSGAPPPERKTSNSRAHRARRPTTNNQQPGRQSIAGLRPEGRNKARHLPRMVDRRAAPRRYVTAAQRQQKPAYQEVGHDYRAQNRQQRSAEAAGEAFSRQARGRAGRKLAGLVVRGALNLSSTRKSPAITSGREGAFRARHPSPRPSRPGGKGASRPLSSRVQPAGRFASLSAPMT